MRPSPVLTFLLLAACAPKDRDTGAGEGEGEGASEGEGEGEGSSEGEGEGEGGASGGSGEAADCPAYSGFNAVGNSWTYANTRAGYAGTHTETLTSISASTGEVVADLTLSYAGPDYSLTGSGTVTYRCFTDGLYRWEESYDFGGTDHGAEISGWSRSTYADMLLVPPDLGSSVSWTVSATTTTETDTTAAVTTPYDEVWTAVEKEVDLTVSGGSFLALEAYGDDTSTEFRWYNRDAGLILTDDDELTAYAQ